jgi:hypothetical protein
MSSPASETTYVRRRVRSGAAACGTTPSARNCPCAPWLTSGQQTICEDEVPVEGPTVISVIVEGGLAE